VCEDDLVLTKEIGTCLHDTTGDPTKLSVDQLEKEADKQEGRYFAIH
jgi:hypothetical protein